MFLFFFLQATQTVFPFSFFKIFFLLRSTLDFVQERLTETMIQHLCPGWNAQDLLFVCFVLVSVFFNGSATLCRQSGDTHLCRITLVKMFL